MSKRAMTMGDTSAPGLWVQWEETTKRSRIDRGVDIHSSPKKRTSLFSDENILYYTIFFGLVVL